MFGVLKIMTSIDMNIYLHQYVRWVTGLDPGMSMQLPMGKAGAQNCAGK